jgi:hypothetical protein
MQMTITCPVCRGAITQHWELFASHIHWQATPRNTARQEGRPGLKERAQQRMPHLGWLRTRKGRR